MNEVITGAPAGWTVMVAELVADPAALVAVRVYVLVLVGDTDMFVPATAPMPWSMERLVAPETVHDSVAV